jgi:hypothetical protein
MARGFKLALCLAIILVWSVGCVPPPRDSGPPRKPAPQRPEQAPSRPDPSRPDSGPARPEPAPSRPDPSRPGSSGPSRSEQAPPREPDGRGSGASLQSGQRQNDQRQNDQRQDIEYDFAAFARTGEWGFICHAAMLGSKEASGMLRDKGVRCGS